MAVRSGPSTARPVVTLAFWLDLLGYGCMLNKARFDPTCREASSAIERLRRFQEVVANHSLTVFPTLVINDGAVAYRDTQLKATDRILPFIDRCWNLFQDASQADLQLGGVGLRGVLAAGLRAKGSNRGILAQNEALTKIIRDLADGLTTKEQAIELASRVQRVSDVVPQLQANFAFSRAYLAEQGASEGKLEGSRFYLETSVFREGVPDWMLTGAPVHWKPASSKLSTLAATFVEVQDVRKAANRENALRTGSELLPVLRNA